MMAKTFCSWVDSVHRNDSECIWNQKDEFISACDGKRYRNSAGAVTRSILMDVEMPRMSGIGSLRALREMPFPKGSLIR